MPKLVFYYSRENRCSINALAGALLSARVKGLELSFPGTEEDFFKEARAAAPGGAAAVSFFTSQKRFAAALAARLRGCGLLLIAGGPHTSAKPEEALAMGFDCAVTGEGEEAMIALMRALASGERPSGVVKGGRAPLEDFPPFPAKLGLFGPIEITRGCPFACAYCQTSFLFGGRPRHRPVKDILTHMRAMFSAGIKDVRFITPDAFGYGSPDGRELTLPAVRELLEGAGKLSSRHGGRIYFGSFPSEVRPEHVTPETLALTRRYASNRRLIIGAQTGSARLLKAVRRGHGVAHIRRACELCLEHKLTPYFDFIFGLPGETRADEKETEALIEELSSKGAIIHTHAFMPLPGTPLSGTGGPGITRTAEAFLKKMEARGRTFGKWRDQRRLAAED